MRDAQDGCTTPACTAVNTPYNGCTTPACTAVNNSYNGCTTPACTAVTDGGAARRGTLKACRPQGGMRAWAVHLAGLGACGFAGLLLSGRASGRAWSLWLRRRAVAFRGALRHQGSGRSSELETCHTLWWRLHGIRLPCFWWVYIRTLAELGGWEPGSLYSLFVSGALMRACHAMGQGAS